MDQGLRVCIRRGASEIGGSCVELASDGRRLVVDLGLPLDADLADDVPLPEIRGLDGTDPTLLGVVISHSHPDHWGLAQRIDPSVPLYMGEVTAQILREARFFTPTGADFAPERFLRNHEPLSIGPFTVTPHLVDHSAFDAYALEIQAAGKRLLYSGDFRGHGSRRHLIDDLVRTVGRPVDALLLEGTHVREVTSETPENTLTEQDIQDRCIEIFNETSGMVLAAYSPQNVDRMISLYRAARASGRKLVLDLYAASIAAALDDPDVPRWDADDVLIYVPLSQRIKVKRTGEFDRVNRLHHRRIYAGDLAQRAGELVMTFRASMAREFANAGCLDGSAAIWSMWAGYLTRSEAAPLREWLEANTLGYEVVHASGHASVDDLQKLALEISAGEVVPIHTASPHRFREYFSGAVVRPDDEPWVL